jgi:hypothetical protein
MRMLCGRMDLLDGGSDISADYLLGYHGVWIMSEIVVGRWL